MNLHKGGNMNNILIFIKKIFGKYENGYEYYVYLKDIEITPQFSATPPRPSKFAQKYDWYIKTGNFQSPIILSKDFTLVNGYTSYLIAKKVGIEKVPVYFEG